MRIIGGEFGSRRIKSIPGDGTRPTPDRMRESLFSVLAPRIEGVTFLDAYAGTGAVGIEAVSRGAAKAILIEKHKEAVACMEENVRSLGLKGRVQIVRGSVQLLLGRYAAEIVFLDPPYTQPKEYERALNVLGESGAAELVIAQHASRQELAETYGRLRRTRVLRQGDNSLSFYEPVDVGSQEAGVAST
jgi:16S rRNA (guanine(966)-N(2))-methyltransferase RsmD